ncbi:hypothetical protein AB1Y20_015098 [Prymnesium parvum]|uniref:ABC transporter domain-containing protein n=1 Tax=Prymnesium parvum TaxID=97485 RepID=A0AB34JXJ2_PRYPA
MLEVHPPLEIPWLNVGFAALLMAAVAGASRALRLGLAEKVLIASTRTVLQLLALGALLYPIFAHNQPYVVLPYILLMATFATREAVVKPKFFYPAMAAHFFVSILLGLATSFAVCVTLVLRPSPWWDAQYMIPVCGMLLGACVNALSLGVDRFLSTLAESPALHECMLAAGASSWEAALPAVRAALLTGLTPTLNQMSVIGLVSIPGMMTGTVLAGSPPLLAAKYQMVIMFLISFTSCAVLVYALALAVFRALFDASHRLRSHLVLRREGPKPQDLLLAASAALLRAIRRTPPPHHAAASALPSAAAPPPLGAFTPSRPASRPPHPPPLLELRAAAVRAPGGGRPLLRAAALRLHAGESVALAGASGSGKSTLLKALARLHPLSSGTVALRGAVAAEGDAAGARGGRGACEWRCAVVYVRQQGGQGIGGTPLELMRQLLALEAQVRRAAAEGGERAEERLLEAVDALQMERALLECSWSSLSGGEAQRLYLCVMLALRPQVILLDEVTSACDPHATQLVEALVRQSGIAAVWVTHDAAQMERVADSVIEYLPAPSSELELALPDSDELLPK